jgi:ribonuclease HI
MDIARQSTQFAASEMRALNYCRLYLDVTTVADITTEPGTNIIDDLEWGEAVFPHRNRHHRAHQTKPALFFWTYWQKFLRLISDRRGRLHTPLEKWLAPGSDLRREWTAYYDSKYHKIFRRNHDDYYQYDVFDTRCINGAKTIWEPSNSSVPIRLLETSQDCWELKVSAHSIVQHPAIHPFTSFKAYILSLPNWEREILMHVKLHTTPIHIMELLSQTPLSDSESVDSQQTNATKTKGILTSDGSDKDANMTFGWALSTGKGTRLATCSGPAHGKSSSHRAEATGMLSGTSFIHRLSQYSGLSPDKLDLFSDNKGLITRIHARRQYSKNHPNATLAPDWDLVEQIHRTMEDIKQHNQNFSPTITHVKGHQDDHTLYAALPLEAQLNVDADAAAGAFHTHAQYKGSQAAPLLPTTKAQLYIGEHTITSQYRRAIRHAAAINEFWLQSQYIHQWTPGIFGLINQEHIRSSVRANCHQHTFIFKWMHHLLPTQEYKNKWDFCTTGCPRCNEVDDQQHFLRCTAAPVATWRTALLSSLR